VFNYCLARHIEEQLDCLSVHIESGKYYYDIDGYGDKYLNVHDGFATFFIKVLKESAE